MEYILTCEHRNRNPEGVEWQIEDSLDHFINCLNRENQIQHWIWYREDWDAAHRCRLLAHDDQIRQLQQHIMKLREQLDRKD